MTSSDPYPSRERVRLKRPVDLFAQVNRNLMNYPLARDLRVRASWSKSNTGRWFCDLPADKRIRLRLAHDQQHSTSTCCCWLQRCQLSLTRVPQNLPLSAIGLSS